MLIANPALIAAHKPLLDYFGNSDVAFNPWWWPMNSGSSSADFGLGPDVRETVFESLRPGKGSPLPGFQGVRGSIGAEPGCAMIITTRPSTGTYPSKGNEVLRRVVNPHGREPGPNIHVTDLVKFRGAGGDSKFDRGLNLQAWMASLDCLEAELDALRPTLILVSKGALAAVTDWLPRPRRRVRKFNRWEDQVLMRHEATLRRIAEGAKVSSLTPRHFGGENARLQKQAATVDEYKALLVAYY